MSSEKQEISRRTGLFIHLGIYIVINALFAVINFVFTPTFIWFIYPVVLWGVALLFHFWTYLVGPEKKKHSIIWVFMSNIVSFGVLLIVLGVLNILVDYVDNTYFQQSVVLINDNIGLILTFFVIFFIGDVVTHLNFPLNLPAPLINAIGAMFLLTFIFRVFTFLDSLIEETIFQHVEEYSFLIYPIVFFIVVIGGYISLLANIITEKKEEVEVEEEKEPEKATWDDVGEEFRKMLFEAFRYVRNSMKKERKE